MKILGCYLDVGTDDDNSDFIEIPIPKNLRFGGGVDET